MPQPRDEKVVPQTQAAPACRRHHKPVNCATRSVLFYKPTEMSNSSADLFGRSAAFCCRSRPATSPFRKSQTPKIRGLRQPAYPRLHGIKPTLATPKGVVPRVKGGYEPMPPPLGSIPPPPSPDPTPPASNGSFFPVFWSDKFTPSFASVPTASSFSVFWSDMFTPPSLPFLPNFYFVTVSVSDESLCWPELSTFRVRFPSTAAVAADTSNLISVVLMNWTVPAVISVGGSICTVIPCG